MGADRDSWSEVSVGEVRIVVSAIHPVAVVRGPDPEMVASWPDLDLGSRATSSTILPAPTGAWVFYRPQGSEDPTLPDGTPGAVHVAVDGQTTCFTRVGGHQPVGATRQGLWVTSGQFPDPTNESAWHGPHPVEVLTPAGARHRITIDRRIAFAVESDESPRLILYEGAPASRSARFGATKYVYRYLSVSVDNSVPDRIRITDLNPEPIDDQELVTLITPLAPRPVDVPSIGAVSSWKQISLSTAQRDAAVASTLREFDGLASYWHAQDGHTSPLSHGLADVRVEAIGEWPHTRVEVSFTHPHYPEGRLRRTYRVFDDAGRANSWMYAAVHLMEKLAKRALPTLTNAHGGILDI